MTPARPPCRGYSLIEVLVVIVIVGILSMVGVTMMGSKPSGAVRAVMDELEGTLVSAQKLAVASGRDVLVVSEGDWGGGTRPMMLAYGYADQGANTTNTILTAGRRASEAFHVAIGTGGNLLREHMHAGVVTANTAGWWTTAATGAASMDISGVVPFNSGGIFHGVLEDADLNLFRSGDTAGLARISGTNKRYTTGFWIEIVGLVDGQPRAGVPMGVLVIQANGAQVFKFYNPGTYNGGDGTWRRI